MKSYPKMKDSGVEWIGEIPEHWNVLRLKYLADITTGGKDTVDNEEDGRYPFFVRSQTIERISTYSCDEEAVLTAGDGVGVGKVFHYINGKFDFHQRVYKISNFKKITGKYFYHYMKENFYKEVMKLSAKSTVDSLRLPMVQNFPIAFGNQEESIRIAIFLDNQISRIDSELERNQKLVELLKEKRQVTINHAVTKGLDLSVPMTDSGIEWIGKIPKHWNVRKLKSLCDLITDGSHFSPEHQDNGFPMATVENIKNNKVDILSCHKITKSDFELLIKNGCQPEENDVLFTKDGTIGVSIVYNQDDKIVLLSSIAIIRNTKSILSPNFCKFFLDSDLIKTQIGKESHGSALQRLILKQIKNFTFLTPPLNDQKQIADFLDKETSKINLLLSKTESQIEKLEDFRQSLTSSAVTGKIDVRGTIV